MTLQPSRREGMTMEWVEFLGVVAVIAVGTFLVVHFRGRRKK